MKAIIRVSYKENTAFKHHALTKQSMGLSLMPKQKLQLHSKVQLTPVALANQ